MNNWNREIARKWMQDNIEKYATKAVGVGPVFTRHTALMETVGALAWALNKGLGLGSRDEFARYMTQACGWVEKNIANAADKIEAESKSQPAPVTPTPLPPASRHIRVAISDAPPATTAPTPAPAPKPVANKAPVNDLPHVPATHVNEQGERVKSVQTKLATAAVLATLPASVEHASIPEQRAIEAGIKEQERKVKQKQREQAEADHDGAHGVFRPV